MLNPEVGIVVALDEGGFGIPKDIMQWLKDSLQNAH